MGSQAGPLDLKGVPRAAALQAVPQGSKQSVSYTHDFILLQAGTFQKLTGSCSAHQPDVAAPWFPKISA